MALAVREVGAADRPTVLLLHGVATSAWMWDRVVERLRGELHVLAPDLPGHGDSAGRPWGSMQDTADAVVEMVESRAHGGQAHVVGLSLGGHVAADLAATRPDLVPSAVVSGINVLPFPRPRLMRLAGRVMSPFMTSSVLLRANARALRVPPEDVGEYTRAARAMAPGTFLRVGGELMDHPVPAVSRTSTTRVLALAGEREQGLVVRSLGVVAGAFPQGEARIVPGVGHAWNGEDPDLFADVVRAQVAGARLPGELVTPAYPG